MLQTLFSTTTSALSDGTKYKNILRVVPEDRKQASVRNILIIIVQNEKEYYTVVHLHISVFDFTYFKKN